MERGTHGREPDWTAVVEIYEEALTELPSLLDDDSAAIVDRLSEVYGEAVLERHIRGSLD